MILEEFKEIFCNRYLPSLRERYWHSHKEPRVTSKDIPKEGQIVQIKGERNREDWKVGKIISLVKGTDGLCRIAKVKVGNTTYTRSITHLYPLEVEEPGSSNINVPHYDGPPKFTNDYDDETGRNTTHGTEVESTNQIDLQEEVLPVVSQEVEPAAEEGTNESADIPEESLEENIDNPESFEHSEIEEIGQSKEKRSAAIRALEKIREWTRDLTDTLL